MAWYANFDQSGAWAPRGTSPDERLMPSGTLMVQFNTYECVYGSALLSFAAHEPWHRTIALHLDDKGNPEIHITSSGQTVVCAKSQFVNRSTAKDILVTYAWDAPNRTARLTVSDTTSFQGHTEIITGAPPLFRSDLLALASQVAGSPVVFTALSDTLEPIGPMPGIDPLTMINTPTGLCRAGELRSGDQVETDAGPQTILARLNRALPAVGAFKPVRLCAPFHGLKRHLTVARHQSLVFGGADVEYAFGDQSVHIPAGQLEARGQPVFEPGLRLYCQFLLPKPAGILAQGAILSSVNIGRLRRQKSDLAMTLLNHLPIELLPEHGDTDPQAFPEYAFRMLADGRSM